MSYILDALRRSEQERHQEQLNSLTGQDALMHVQRNKPLIWPYIIIVILLLNAAVIAWLVFDKQEVVIIEKEISASNENMTAEKGLTRQDILPQPLDQTMPAQNTYRPERTVSQTEPAASPKRMADQAATGYLPVQNESVDNGVSQAQVESTAQVPSDIPEGDVYIDGGLLIQPKNKSLLPSNLPYSASASSVSSLNIRPTPTVTVAPVPIAMPSENSSPEYADVPYLAEMESQFQRSIPGLTFNSHIYSDTPSARRVMINNIYLREGQMLSSLEIVQIGEQDIVFRKGDTLFKRGVMRDW